MMPRIRSLKPEFFEDEDLAELNFWIRILYQGLWVLADREGRLEDRPIRIKAKIFPYDNVKIEDGLSALTGPKRHSPNHPPFIARYEVDGEKYIQVLNFDKHQSPHNTEKESSIPPFNGELTVKEPLNNLGGPAPHYPETINHEPETINQKKALIESVVLHLNEMTGKHFKPNAGDTIDLISGRISEGRTIEEFKHVIDVKSAEWLGDKKMDKFLRPATLFNKTNFESYVNERIIKKADVGSGPEKTNAEKAKAAELKKSVDEYVKKMQAKWDPLIEAAKNQVERDRLRVAANTETEAGVSKIYGFEAQP